MWNNFADHTSSLTFGATFVAYACALFAYLYLLFTNPGYNSNGSYTAVIVAFAFL